MVEDVVTCGGRVQEMIDIVRAHGGVVAKVATLVDSAAATSRILDVNLQVGETECGDFRGKQPARRPGWNSCNQTREQVEVISKPRITKLPVEEIMINWILKKMSRLEEPGAKSSACAPSWRRSTPSSTNCNRYRTTHCAPKRRSGRNGISKIEDPNEQNAVLNEIMPEAFAVVKNTARRLTERKHAFSVCDQPVKKGT